LGADEWIDLSLLMFRAKDMSSGVSNALSIILIEAISKAQFLIRHNMDAVPIVSCRTTWQSLASCCGEQGRTRLEGVNRSDQVKMLASMLF
jgi:hypothetical protein